MICNYDFQLKKDGSPRKRCFCVHPELIENYDLAIKDKENIWYCHHKLEAFFFMEELQEMGKYLKV